MALSKGFRIFEKKTPNHSIILEHRARTNEALLFESQAIAVLCKKISDFIYRFRWALSCRFSPFNLWVMFWCFWISWKWWMNGRLLMMMTETSFHVTSPNEIGKHLFLSLFFLWISFWIACDAIIRPLFTQLCFSFRYSVDTFCDKRQKYHLFSHSFFLSAAQELETIKKQYLKIGDAYGCLGILQVNAGESSVLYLVLVTGCFSVGKLCDAEIFRITQTQFVALQFQAPGEDKIAEVGVSVRRCVALPTANENSNFRYILFCFLFGHSCW